MRKRKQFLPFSLPLIDKKEVSEVVETLRSGWLSIGPKTKKFEKKFAKYIGVKHAVALNSCTAGLHLALLADGVGKGDEVILPSFTFVSTANVIVHVGAKPIFADIKEDTFNIDTEEIERKITKRTKAIIPVHYAGQAVNIDEVNRIAKKYKLRVIEDAAHAVGGEYRNRKIGALGNTTCFSFYATKNMTTGEGGMLTTNNKKLAEFIQINRLHGISKDAWNRYSKKGSWRYRIESAGWKYNMTDVQAALGLHQLSKVDQFIRIRNKYAKAYDKGLKDLKRIETPFKKKQVKHAYHLYPILVKGYSRDLLIEKLLKRNIGTSVHFLPLHLQPFYKTNFNYKKGDLVITEKIAREIVSLPLYPKMKLNDIKYVIFAIKEILEER